MADMRWLVAAVGLFAFSASPGHAAPDNTLGMAILSAGIHTNGTPAFGSGLIAWAKDTTTAGHYYLTFNRDISGCAQTVTPRSYHVSAHLSPGIEPNSIHVYLWLATDTGDAIDAPFHLIVFCNQ